MRELFCLDIELGEKLVAPWRFQVPEDVGAPIGGDCLEKLDCPLGRLRREQFRGVLQPRLVEDLHGALHGHCQERRRCSFERLGVEALDDVGGMVLSEPGRQSVRDKGCSRVDDIVHGPPLLDQPSGPIAVSLVWDQTTPGAGGSRL